jgi:hypothetical protein
MSNAVKGGKAVTSSNTSNVTNVSKSINQSLTVVTNHASPAEVARTSKQALQQIAFQM